MFFIGRPVPDVLVVEYEVVVVDRITNEVLERWTLRSHAEVDKHRRWVVIDAFES